MWETFPIQVSGGLITNQPPIQQGIKSPGSATRLVNFESSVEGGYRRISGFTKWAPDVVPAATSTSPILGLYFFQTNAVAVREGSIYASTGGAWSTLASGRTHSGKHRYHTFNFNGTRKMIGVDGSNYPYTWDGTTFTNLSGSTDVQGASQVISFKDHMFYAKGSLVTFSEPFDEDGFDTGLGAGAFRVDSTVNGFAVFRERLFIFTAYKIYALSGSSSTDFALSSVAEDIGCLFPDTVQEVGGDIMFLAADGLRLLGATERNDDFANTVASKPIQSELTRLMREYTGFTSITVRGKSQYRLMCYLPGKPWELTEGIIGVQTMREQTIDNPEGFEWSLTQGIKSFVASSEVWNGVEYVLFAGVCNLSGQLAYVYRLESGSTFDDVEIDASFWTPYISFQDPVITKTLYTMTFYFSPEGEFSGDFSLNFDQNNSGKIQPPSVDFAGDGGGFTFGSGMSIFGTSIFAAPPDSSIRKQLIGSGKNASLQFNFQGGSPFTIDTILIEYSMNDRR